MADRVIVIERVKEITRTLKPEPRALPTPPKTEKCGCGVIIFAGIVGLVIGVLFDYAITGLVLGVIFGASCCADKH